METTRTFLMYGVLLSRSVTLNWPWLRNYVLSAPGFSLNASTARPYTDYWYDKSKQT